MFWLVFFLIKISIRLPDLIFYEEGSLSKETINELKKLNHIFYNNIAPGGALYLARTHGIQKKNREFITGADKRGKQNGNEALTY